MALGGKRPGAGRPRGAKDKATREAGGELAKLARTHTATALGALVHVATNGESEAARVSAASAILDRGYGKPPQPHDGDGQGGPIKLEVITGVPERNG